MPHPTRSIYLFGTDNANRNWLLGWVSAHLSGEQLYLIAPDAATSPNGCPKGTGYSEPQPPTRSTESGCGTRRTGAVLSSVGVAQQSSAHPI